VLNEVLGAAIIRLRERGVGRGFGTRVENPGLRCAATPAPEAMTIRQPYHYNSLTNFRITTVWSMQRKPKAPALPANLLHDAMSANDFPACPIGQHCRPSFVNGRQILETCLPLNPGRCPHAVIFGEVLFCCALWKFAALNPREPTHRPMTELGSIQPEAMP
jgi:hypothetical protein